jgi:hypothetical protein
LRRSRKRMGMGMKTTMMTRRVLPANWHLWLVEEGEGQLMFVG